MYVNTEETTRSFSNNSLWKAMTAYKSQAGLYTIFWSRKTKTKSNRKVRKLCKIRHRLKTERMFLRITLASFMLPAIKIITI